MLLLFGAVIIVFNKVDPRKGTETLPQSDSSTPHVLFNKVDPRKGTETLFLIM